MGRIKTLFIFIAISLSSYTHSGIPTADIAALAQRILDYVEQAKQVSEQVKQYQQMVQQYENMIQNTRNISSWNWDDASDLVDDVLEVGNSIDDLAGVSGSLNDFLSEYKIMSDYIDCGFCKEELKELLRNSSRDQKKTYDASLKYVKVHQSQLRQDSYNLEELQADAQGAEGRLEALQYANQFLSNQSAQLMQVRSLLQTQNTVVTMRMQSQMAEQAMNDARDEYATSSRYKKSEEIAW